ncbi:hypothetical protein NQ317_014913 [Molorchus minor]|uniref:palmitoyl-protein hydrolase n=1 Tax=Molorchus minor TaxID=1323400 RepID=A0ABQ9IT90_9CUCU|nr:hypothetical protein NQ317_014913 [Molorchus minor]
MAAPVILPATVKHTATLIFLHGLGDTGQGWASAMGALRQPHVKVICPTAPTMPVTLNAGYRMPSWFDLKTLDESGQKMSKKESSWVDFHREGALALYTALTYPQKFAGVAALSCWLPLSKSFPAAMKTSDNLPILQCHGDCDPIVSYKLGQMTASALKSMLKDVEFKTYEGLTHSSSDAELRDVKAFIDKHIPSQ